MHQPRSLRMKHSTRSLFSRCCILYLLLDLLCEPSTQCNTNLTQCMKYGGPGQNLITGVTTCFPNGSLSVTLVTHDGWNIGYTNAVTVRYTCWNPDGNEARSTNINNSALIKNGSLWNKAVLIGPVHSSTSMIVESMHHESWCQLHSCYSPDECIFYSINMTGRSTGCSFKIAQTSIPMVRSDTSTQYTYLVSSSSVIVPTLITKAKTAAYGYQMSLVSVQASTPATILMLVTPLPSTATTVPKETTSSDLAAVLPVVIISAAGMITIVTVLLCCVGYKLNYKLNAADVYNSNEVFDPFFKPIDINKGTKDDLAQSFHSIYEGLRNDLKYNVEPGIEDERSITTDGDDKSSVVITEENEQLNHNQIQTDDDNTIDYKIIHLKSSSLPFNSENDQYHSYSPGAPSTECRISKYCEKVSTKLPNDHTMASSTSTRSIKHPNHSSGYITETEEVLLPSYIPSEVLPLQGKQSECTSEVTVNIKAHTPTSITHVSETENSTYSAERDYDITQVHREQFTNILMEGYGTNDNDMNRWRKKSATSTSSECTSDNSLFDLRCFTVPSRNSTGKETCIDHELPSVDQDMLLECHLSLNPSHFQPLDSL